MGDDFGITGKTTLVTGSGRNIGRAIVLELASHGANVIVNARSNRAEADAVAKKAEDLGVRSLVVMGEAADKATVERMQTEAEQTFGGVDIYVSNAARRLYKDFFTITDEDWHYYLDQQLTASWYLAKAFVPGMRDRGWGRVVHINGEDGWLGGYSRIPHSVGKGGLLYGHGCVRAQAEPAIGQQGDRLIQGTGSTVIGGLGERDAEVSGGRVRQPGRSRRPGHPCRPPRPSWAARRHRSTKRSLACGPRSTPPRTRRSRPG